MDEARNRHGAVLIKRIIEPPGKVELTGIGKTLPAKWIALIRHIQKR
jgi:hypothetical protein